MSETNEYPKLMWAPDGVEVTVCSAGEEQEKLAAGFSLTAPGTPVAAEALSATDEAHTDDEPVDEPTFGPPHDQTHAKRGGKKR
jgi:hypothetical protein